MLAQNLKLLVNEKFLIEEFSCEVDVVKSAGYSVSRLLVRVRFHTLDAIIGHFLGEVLEG